MRSLLTLLVASAVLTPAPALAASISTHILDLGRGIGGKGVPVVLEMKGGSNGWQVIGRATTDDNGRVRSFGDKAGSAPGLYRLNFDMSRYPAAGAEPFFPEISVVFRVSEPGAHYHVPVVVSPYGYSTYRGN